jgi:hypothetical protein
MYAGLGTMGGNSPNALTNIGRGALAGLEQFGKERTTAEALAARRANASVMERYRAQMADIARLRLANQERKTDADILRTEAQTNKLISAVGAAGGGGGGSRAKGTWEAAIQRDDEGKEVPGYNWLPNDGSPPKFVPGARGKALIAEAGRNTRAADRGDFQQRVLDFREANAADLADIKKEGAATARFAAENKLTVDQAKLALAGTKQQAESVGARERRIMDMVKVLAATPVYYRKTPEELRAMAVAAVGAGGGGDAPPTDAPKPGAGGVTALPLPAKKEDLKAGVVYETPRGRAYWDGTKFTPLPVKP